MISPQTPAAYFESLMRWGTRLCEDALASVVGGSRKEPASPEQNFLSVASSIAGIQREYFKELGRFWSVSFLQSFMGGASSNAELPKGDKRFKDDPPTGVAEVTR